MNNLTTEAILKQYYQLPPKITTHVHYQNNNIREKDIQGQLQRVCMIYATYLSVHSQHCHHPFTIIVTASHNPPQQNGLKLEPLGDNPSLNEAELESIINDQKQFQFFLQKVQNKLSRRQRNKTVNFFIGRDTRPTSKRLSEVIIRTLELTHNKVIDLGEGSTPEVISLSEYIYSHLQKGSLIAHLQLRNQYFKQIEDSWKRAVQMISDNSGRKWEKKSVYIDFSNGVGAISARNYTFLEEYFGIIKAHDKEFDLPNVNCGAEWIYHHRQTLFQLPLLPKADHYVWFDGDSDRVLARLKEDKEIVQGEDFIVCLTQFLNNLLRGFSHDLKIGCVSDSLVNTGLVKYLSNRKIKLQIASVGIRNLFLKAKQWDISCYFERNGHGCIYFSTRAIDLFDKFSKDFWQAELLLLLHKLTRNNPRGYSFHIFLVFELCLFFNGVQRALFFQKDYTLDKLYDLQDPELFQNSSCGQKLLQKPLKLVQQIKLLQEEYGQLSIKVRKATTSPVIRLSLQGKQALCKIALSKLDEAIKNFTQGKQ